MRTRAILSSFAVAGLAAGLAAPASAQFLFSEIFVNSPGTDDGQEGIEIRGAAAAPLAGWFLLSIEGDGAGAGVVDQRIDLGAFSTGGNGLLLIRDGNGVIQPAPAADTTVVVINFTPDLENGSNTFVLGIGTPPALGTDLDTNNDGTIDPGALDGFTVSDAVSIVENDGAANIGYAAGLGGFNAGPFPNFTPDAVYRVFDCDDAPIGWAGGDVLGTNPGGPYLWSVDEQFGWGEGGIRALVPAQALDLGNLNLIGGPDVNGNGVPDGCEGASCPADLNDDGVVDGADLGILLSQWDGAGSADLNDDGVVDGADLGALLAAWGECA